MRRLAIGRPALARTLVRAMLCATPLVACARPDSAPYDVVIANGRVMDPESGLVVAPGFVDLHEHGQQEESYAMMVRDGVTSAFELEAGTADVARWYADREGGQIVNFGVSVGHIPARMRVLGDPSDGKDILPSGIGGTGSATEPQVAQMEKILRRGLSEGAVAVGMGSAYTPGAPMAELERMFRKEGGTVIIHGRSEEQTRTAILSPLTMIASDGFIVNGRGHPRTSGSFAKVLGRYVRDEGGVPLMEALRKMTLEPARRLEARVPDMARKGRIGKGSDADITLFDPATVIDRATYEDATLASAGIPYVLVNGVVVVDKGTVTAARPGREVRAPTS